MAVSSKKRAKWRRLLVKSPHVGARYLKLASKTLVREKKVETVELALKAFEYAWEKLQKDPEAAELFRKRKVPRLEKKLELVEKKIAGLEAEARKWRDAGNHPKTKKIWRKIENLDIERRTFIMEIRLIKGNA